MTYLKRILTRIPILDVSRRIEVQNAKYKCEIVKKNMINKYTEGILKFV